MEANEPAPPPTEDEAVLPPSIFGDAMLRLLGWMLRGSTIALCAAGVVGVGATTLAMLDRMPTEIAHVGERWSLDVGLASAALAMVVASARSGAIERRHAIARERFRIAAERAHYEAYLARKARRQAEREAAEREAIAAAERAERDAEERAAAAAAAAEAEPPLTSEQIDALQERARLERERREDALRIETAIRNGTRAA